MAYVDNEQEAVKKTLEGEKSKLAQMNFAQKAEYIFSYYRIHIIIALVVIAAIVYIVHLRLNYIDYKLYGVIINSYQYDESLEDTLPELLGMGKHEGVSLIAGLSGDSESNSTGYYNQIDLYTISGQMDFAFTDDDGVQYLCDLGTPWDVTEELPDELLELWSDREVSFRELNADDDSYFDNHAAIDISGTAVHDYFGLDDNMSYLVIVGNPSANEYMDDFYQLLIDIETGKVSK